MHRSRRYISGRILLSYSEAESINNIREGRISEVTDIPDPDATTPTGEAPVTPPAPQEPLIPTGEAPALALVMTDVNGIGSVTAEKIQAAGVMDLTALSQLDEAGIKRVSDATELADDRISEWVEEAKALVGA